MDANYAAADAANGICFPYNVLLDILRRVPGRALAASCRLVCRSWRGIVDSHGLLLPHVFPRVFPGVYASYCGHRRRPLFWNDWEHRAQQHCNGLFLLSDYYCSYTTDVFVCNPATLRYARLPRSPAVPATSVVEGMFLAFDPAVSRHYEVFCFPTEKKLDSESDCSCTDSEPDSWIDLEHPFLPTLFGEEEPYESETPAEEPEERVLHVPVFSSRNGKWESREFTPGRRVSRRLYDVVTAPCSKKVGRWWPAEYWRGSLYVQCLRGVLVILRCSEGTYDMVQLPGDPYGEEDLFPNSLPKRCVLANYDRGICYVVLKELQLKVWELTELGEGQLGWTLTHEANLEAHDRTYLGYIYPLQHHQQAREIVGALPYRPCYIDALPARKTSTPS
ncbi:hypothetical protein BRADI_1g77485v3 [Brachypodium distachyon]|uniref:F-box domain-containing protein n=1 Tax=Brachypodium distachyon TaxID=15368 RepID=A0A0Q3HMV0_BRADI|nr:hypothetical protein BRADI_1g77485v3 [Brachypodium distachyon]